MPDLRISDLPEMTEGMLVADDPLPITDDSASTTKRIKAGTLVLDAIKGLPADSIPIDKVDVSGGLAPGGIGTADLADKSVTAMKLANGSSAGIGPTLPALGIFIGQLYVTTTGTPEIWCWNGTKWIEATGIYQVEGATDGLVNTYVLLSSGTAVISADIDNTTAAAQFLAGPTNAGGAVSQRQIVSNDLPTASSDKGAVAVNGNGLKMSGSTIAIDNSVVANSGAGKLVQFNNHGLVTGGAGITPADLPLSKNGNVGAVQPGPGLSVDGTGTIGISNSVAGGTFPKITFNEQGLCTAGQSLTEDDIPDLTTDKIVSGDFGTSFISDEAITAPKIANYATCLMQESSPGIGDFLGQLWWQPSTAQLRIYSGSSSGDLWMPVGFGVLQQSQLRWAGTYDASTSKITTLTSYGLSSGMEVGPIPNSTDDLTGVYLLCVEGGSNVDVPALTGKNHSIGDWIVALGDEWMFLDVSSGTAGGGGGAVKLNDLLDVELGESAGELKDGQLFRYNADGFWKNAAVIDGGDF